jgi:dihydroorotate dehydrogenase electron transfer subunit
VSAKPQVARATVAGRQQLAEGVFSYWLECPGIASSVKPGQFVMVRVNDTFEPFLSRPLSVAQQQAGRIRLVFRVVGRGTAVLAQSKIGDTWNLLGPLGREIPRLQDRDIVLVGGGVGIAPLLFLAEKAASRNRTVILLGARDKPDLILRREFRRLPAVLSFATEDGSLGKKGLVTDLLGVVRTALPSKTLVIACGPRPMLRRVKEIAQSPPRIEAYGFWEERMGCGTGICYGCAVRSARGGNYIRFCQEGPALDLSEVEI